MIGYVVYIIALAHGYDYYNPSSYAVGSIVAHGDFIRHLINMGVVNSPYLISFVVLPLSVSDVPNKTQFVRRVMKKDKENLVGIRNVVVSKLLAD